MRYGVVVLAMTLAPSLAGAQGAQVMQSDSGPVIVASATRTARLAADRAGVFASVEVTAESATEAVQRGDRKVHDVVDAAGKLGLAGQTVSAAISLTPGAGISPYQPYPAAGPGLFTSRYVVRVLEVRLDQLGALGAALVTAGASNASVSFFEVSAADSARRGLRAEAVDEARRDAEALAVSLGGRLGALLEATSSSAPVPATTTFVTFQPTGGPTQAPDVLVSASATLRFRFVPR